VLLPNCQPSPSAHADSLRRASQAHDAFPDSRPSGARVGIVTLRDLDESVYRALSASPPPRRHRASL
jgi:hypothetical protein